MSDRNLNRLVAAVFTLIVISTMSFAVYYVVGLQREKAKTPASQLIQGIQDAIRKKPRDVGLRIRLAEVLLSQARTGEAISTLQTALEIDKRNAGVYLVMGLAYSQDNNPNEAIKSFLKVIELRESAEYSGIDMTLEQAHFYAGALYLRQKNYDESIVHLKSALRIKRSSSDSHLYLAKAYEAKQWYGKAMQEYQIAVTFDPRLAEAQYELGRLYERQHDKVKAIQHYRLATVAMPNRREPKEALARFGDEDSRYAAGQTYLQKKKYPQAIQEFKLALAFEPAFVNAHYALGQALEGAGQKAKAIVEYRLALRYDPALSSAKTALKRLGAK